MNPPFGNYGTASLTSTPTLCRPGDSYHIGSMTSLTSGAYFTCQCGFHSGERITFSKLKLSPIAATEEGA